MANDNEVTHVRKNAHLDEEEITEVEDRAIVMGAQALGTPENTVTDYRIPKAGDLTLTSVNLLTGQNVSANSPIDEDEPTVDFQPDALEESLIAEVLPHQRRISRVGKLILFGLVLIGISFIVLKWYQGRVTIPRKSTPHPSPVAIGKSPAGAQGFKPSALEFLDESGQPVSAMSLLPGNTVVLRFRANPTQVPGDKPLPVKASFRLYALSGELLVNRHEIATFEDTLDTGREKLVVETKLHLAENTPLGIYRVMIDITNTHSGRQASVQGRIKVVAK